MRKDAQAVLLLLVGGTLVKIAVSGTYLRYVGPRLLPLLVLTGSALITVAGMSLWLLLRPRAQLAEPTGEDDQHVVDEADEGGEPSRPAAAWLLALPILALLLFSPPALGSFLANHQGTVLSGSSSGRAGSNFGALPDGDPVPLPLLNYASRAILDQGRSLAGRRVRLTGFVIAGPSGQPYLARMVVSCCAADARPVKVGLTGQVPPQLTAGTWLEVDGSYSNRLDHDPVNRGPIPFLQVAASRVISPPEQPYESQADGSR